MFQKVIKRVFPGEGLSLEKLGKKFPDVIRSTTAPEDQREIFDVSHSMLLSHLQI